MYPKPKKVKFSQDTERNKEFGEMGMYNYKT